MTNSQDFVADLHIHSRYAYACSKSLTLPNIAATARTKGIQLLATGDFTHPEWLAELEAGFFEVGVGTFQHGGVNFVLGTEVSCVYKQGGRSRRIHLLLFLSSLSSVRRFNDELSRRGVKLEGDGRPSVGLSAPDLTALVFDLDPQAMVIPAHIWTPWYGMLGSVSGFDSLDECFGEMTPAVRAVETGLSSDPRMNWGVPELAERSIVSFSDAHSLPNLGRESTVFKGPPTYAGLRDAMEHNAIAYTVEFYPEEGKYHYNGHRKCGVRQMPGETAQQANAACPVCGRPLTLGVLHRVNALSSGLDGLDELDELAGLADGDGDELSTGWDGLIRSPQHRPPYMRLVPLEELLAETLGVGRRSKAVARMYQRLCKELGSELEVLARADESDLLQVAGELVAEAILRARRGQVMADPGFDGQYGTVRVWDGSKGDTLPADDFR